MQLTRKHFLIGGAVVIIMAASFGLYLNHNRQSVQTQPVAGLSSRAFIIEKNKLVRLLNTQGIDASFAEARQKIASDPAYAHDCHPLLHGLGQAAFGYYGSFAEAMVYADEICNSGYVHGLIEANFSSTNDVAQTVKTICDQTADGTFAQWQCYHGVGHGAMYVTDRNLRRSLQLCQTLPASFARESCGNGVFMEQFITTTHSGLAIDPRDVPGMGLCAEQATADKANCYLYAPTGYLALHHSDYPAALRWCQAAAAPYASVCAGGVGYEAMKDNIENPALSAAVCQAAASSYRQACAAQAVGQYMYHFGASAAAQPLCNDAFKAFARTCQATIVSERKALQF